MGPLRKAMVYLGLVDDDYDDFEPYDEPAPSGPVRAGRTAEPEPAYAGGLRAIPGRDEGVSMVSSSAVTPRPVVRPVAAPKAPPKVHVLAVTDFSDAQQVGAKVRDGDVVMVNLQGAPPELTRRLIDFCSGLTFGVGGKMERAARQVYLLRPADVEMPDDEKARLQERGLYNNP